VIPGRRSSHLVAAAILIALTSALIGRASAPDGHASDTAPATHAHGELSARAAAIRAVALVGDPEVLRGGRRGDLRALIAPGASAAVAARLTVPAPIERATGLLADMAAGRPVVGYVAPVAAQVVDHSATSVNVDVWTVSVLGTRRLGVAGSFWSTESVRMSWDGGWKVTDLASRPGPTPAATQAATPLQQILRLAAGMSRYDDAGR
jgi:hypothetical protein